MDNDLERPDPKIILLAGGFTGIVCPGECGCRLDDLMPCGASAENRDHATGIPIGCQPGYAHEDPRGGDNWVVSTKREAPVLEVFDMWAHVS